MFRSGNIELDIALVTVSPPDKHGYCSLGISVDISKAAVDSARIVPRLREGAGVVTTRAHIHYVVTEYGHVNLHGKSTEERIELLISIAHPDHRDCLRKEAFHG